MWPFNRKESIFIELITQDPYEWEVGNYQAKHKPTKNTFSLKKGVLQCEQGIGLTKRESKDLLRYIQSINREKAIKTMEQINQERYDRIIREYEENK